MAIFFIFRETLFSTRFKDVYYNKGRRHGFYRTFRIDKRFEEMGIYINGHLFGDFILKCEGNSYIIGKHPSKNEQDDCKTTNTCIDFRWNNNFNGFGMPIFVDALVWK